jgi:SAM-dependent methyltransferase
MIIVDPYRLHLGGCILGQPDGVGDVDTWAPEIWDNIILKYNIKSVIDVGCGGGYSLRYFLEKGLDGIGVEGLDTAREVSPVREKIKIHDYTVHPFFPEKQYDFAWCCEFVEHVEEKYIPNFMTTLSFCEVVAITHAIPGQNGYHHVNEQPAEYWINVFNNYGYKFEQDYSLQLRSSLIDEQGNELPHGKWVKNSLMVFTK